jgi:hypothetical protein
VRCLLEAVALVRDRRVEHDRDARRAVARHRDLARGIARSAHAGFERRGQVLHERLRERDVGVGHVDRHSDRKVRVERAEVGAHVDAGVDARVARCRVGAHVDAEIRRRARRGARDQRGEEQRTHANGASIHAALSSRS